MTLLAALSIAVFFLPMGTLAAATQGTSGASQGRGQYQDGGVTEMQDLVWLLVGIKQMDKDPKLRLTEKQAKAILPLVESLVKQKIIQLEIPKTSQQAWGPSGGQNANKESGPQNMNAANREKFRKERQEQAKAIASAMDKIEKVLTDRQIQFVDDFDFRPEDYGMGGFGSRQGFDRQNPPSQEQIQALREEARKNTERLVTFNKDLLAFLRSRAKVSTKG